MKNTFLVSLVLLFLISCSGQTKQEDNLFQFNHVVEKDSKLSDLLDSVEFIPLETNDESLLPGLSKLLGMKDYIYASAEAEILKFDKRGCFVGKLSRLGNGPEDYLSINDYDIVSRNGNEEIWIAHQRGISCYNAKDFSFLEQISLDVPVLHFKYVSDNAIVIQTSGEYSFYLCNKEGALRNAYLPNDPANLSHSMMQFVDSDNGIFCILAGTDEAVHYNDKQDNLELLRYVGGIDNVLTRSDNKDYMDKYGYLEYSQKVARDFVNIVTFRQKAGNTMFFLRSGSGEKMLINKRGSDEWESYDIYPTPSIENDLLEGLNVRYFLSMASCDSDNSFIMSVPAVMIAGSSVNGRIVDEEDNPIVIKYQLKKDSESLESY